MRIRMLKTMPGSPDGGRTQLYRAGEIHDLGATERQRELAAVFLREKWAEEVKPEPAQKPAPPLPAPAPTTPAEPPKPAPDKDGHGGRRGR